MANLNTFKSISAVVVPQTSKAKMPIWVDSPLADYATSQLLEKAMPCKPKKKCKSANITVPDSHLKNSLFAFELNDNTYEPLTNTFYSHHEMWFCIKMGWYGKGATALIACLALGRSLEAPYRCDNHYCANWKQILSDPPLAHHSIQAKSLASICST